MDDSAYDNLALLRDAFGAESMSRLFSKETFSVDGIEFVSDYDQDSTPDRFVIVKPLHLVERYRSLCSEFEGGRIIELGIAKGGSAALMALWADPEKLVAVDLEPNRVIALDEFVERRGLANRVRPHYGVDQSDRARLQEIVADEFGGAPVDLIIDDASHMFEPTRASFEALFPLLRPGGRYLIEDWNADVEMVEVVRRVVQDPDNPYYEQVKARFGEALREKARSGTSPEAPTRVPLVRFALELTLGCAAQRGLVDEVSLNRSYVSVTRGAAEVDASTFSMADVYADSFKLLGDDAGRSLL